LAFSAWFAQDPSPNPLIICVHKTTKFITISTILFCDEILCKYWNLNKMESSLLDWGGNMIHFYGNKINLKHLKISPFLQNGHLYGVSNSLEKYFKIFRNILSDCKSQNGRCYMIYWCFLIVCHLSFLLKLAPWEHFICRHSQKLQCNPLKHSRVALNFEHSNWLVTADVLNFLHANHGEVFERFVWWLTRAPFKKIFQIWKKKHLTLKQFDTLLSILQMPYVMF